MIGWVGNTNRRFSTARWLLIPLTIALFALVGLAISTERRQDYQSRQTNLAAQDAADAGTRNPDDTPTRPPVGSFTRKPATPRAGQGSGDGGDTVQASGQGGAPTGQQAPASVKIQAPAGTVTLNLQGFRPLAQAAGTDGQAQPPVQLRPGPTGPTAIPAPQPGDDPNAAPAGPAPSTGEPSVGVRLNPDGTLEPVGTGQIGGTDLVLAPAQGGFDVVRPDGSRIEVRPADAASDPRTVFGATGPGTGLQATRIGADGRVKALRPDGSGQIDLGDGTTLQVPRPDQATAGPRPVWRAALSDHLRLVALAALAVVLAAGAGVILWRRRRRRAGTEPFGPGWVGPDGVPADRLEEFLALLAADPDPARAVRLAFSAAERGVGRVPARGATETAFEWHRRVVANHPEVAEPLAGLCVHFADARFAPTPVTPADRTAALAEVRELARLGREPAGGPRILVGAGAAGGAAARAGGGAAGGPGADGAGPGAR